MCKAFHSQGFTGSCKALLRGLERTTISPDTNTWFACLSLSSSTPPLIKGGGGKYWCLKTPSAWVQECVQTHKIQGELPHTSLTVRHSGTTWACPLPFSLPNPQLLPYSCERESLIFSCKEPALPFQLPCFSAHSLWHTLGKKRKGERQQKETWLPVKARKVSTVVKTSRCRQGLWEAMVSLSAWTRSLQLWNWEEGRGSPEERRANIPTGNVRVPAEFPKR